MKPITLHPSSLFAGAALAGLAFVAMAQQPLQEEPRPVGGLEAMVRAKDWFEIEQGVPYVVPTGKLLVIRALGTRDLPGSNWEIEVRLDGVAELSGMARSLSALGYGTGTSMVEVPRLFTVPAGTTVDIVPPGPGVTDARAWAYLADA